MIDASAGARRCFNIFCFDTFTVKLEIMLGNLSQSSCLFVCLFVCLVNSYINIYIYKPQ